MIVLSVDAVRRKLIVVVNTHTSYARISERGYNDLLHIAIDNYYDEELDREFYEHETDDDDYYEEEYMVLRLPYGFTGEVHIKDSINIGWLIQCIKNCDKDDVMYVTDYKRVKLGE